MTNPKILNPLKEVVKEAIKIAEEKVVMPQILKQAQPSNPPREEQGKSKK